MNAQQIMPSDMRARVDAQHRALNENWRPLEDRFCYVAQERPVSGRATEAPPEPVIRNSIAEHCNRKTFGEKSCLKCHQPFLAMAATQLVCGRNECRKKRNTEHAANHRGKLRANKATCLHADGWLPQATEGRYSRYERCRTCNKGRVVGGERLATGRKRVAPEQDKATCPHLAEWRSTVKKNKGFYQKCKACRTIRVSLDHETKKGPK